MTAHNYKEKVMEHVASDDGMPEYEAEISAPVDRRYFEPKPGEWHQLSLPPHFTFDRCCDCGLTHKIEYELRPITSGRYKGEPTLWCRTWRDERRTAAVRQHSAARTEKCDPPYMTYKRLEGRDWIVVVIPKPERKRKRK